MTLFLAILIFLTGCASATTMARTDGENLQWKSFMSIAGEPASHETEIRVKIVVVESFAKMPIKGAAATYSIGDNQDRVIHIIGKLVNGKIIVPTTVLGHEIQHVLQFQDGAFVDPDRLTELGY